MQSHVSRWTKAVLLAGFFAMAGCASVTTMRHPEYGMDCADFGANVDCVRVYYGTNRRVALPAGALPAQAERDVSGALNENGEQLVLGRADIWLPKLIKDGGDRELGETPFVMGDVPSDRREQEKYVFITRITAAGQTRFTSDLQGAIDAEGHESALLFIHGFNVAFDTALIRSAQLAVDLREGVDFDPGTPVLFSWPSNANLSIDSYRSDRDRSAASAPYLTEFLNILTRDLRIRRINIIAHSMGNRILTRALETYAADYLASNPEQEIEFRIVLAAADVERDLFDEVADKISIIEPNVTIYSSDADRALNFAKLITGNIRLGDTNGNKPYIREQSGYITVDATPVATELFGLGHGYYSDNPFILNDIRCAMADTPPDSRALGRRTFGDLPNGLGFFWTDPDVEPEQVACNLRRQSFPRAPGTRTDDDDIFAPALLPAPPPQPTTPLEDRSGVMTDEAYCAGWIVREMVEFDPGSALLSVLAEDRLARTVAELKSDDTCAPGPVMIETIGDGSVDQRYDENLAERRALAIRLYLERIGVSPADISVKPAGPRAQPGRVEVVFESRVKE